MQKPPSKWWLDNATRLNLKTIGSELKGPCPACGGDDRFHVHIVGAKSGLFGCRNCKDFVPIIRAAGWVDSSSHTSAVIDHHQNQKIVQRLLSTLVPDNDKKSHDGTIDTWDYFTTDGKSVSVKRERGKGTRPWREPSGIVGTYLPLDPYTTDDDIVIVEGERARDALHHLGINVTCWMGGASGWNKTDWTGLRQSSVILWPDADDVGAKAMDDLAIHLTALDCTIKQIQIPEQVTKGWDAADTDDGTIRRLIDESIPIAQPGQYIAPVPIDIKNYKPLDFVIDKILERGSMSLLFGKPGSGKSTLALAEAVSIASGYDILGLDPNITEGKVALYWPDEGSQNARRKIAGICDVYDLDVNAVSQNMFFVGSDQFEFTASMEGIGEMVKHMIAKYHDFDALYIDSLAAFAPDAEMENAVATMIMRALETIARNADLGIRILHHARKGPVGKTQMGMEEARGASSILGRASIVEQVISQWTDDGKIITIGGDKSDLKYRNTPAPPKREYTIKSGQIDDSKYQPGVIVPLNPKN